MSFSNYHASDVDFEHMIPSFAAKLDKLQQKRMDRRSTLFAEQNY